MATAHKMPSGKWRIQFFTYDKDGKKTRHSYTAKTRWEAERMADEYVEELKAAQSCITVGQAVDEYIDMKRNVLSPSTIHGYEIIRKNRLQSIMEIDIHELNSCDMQKAINEDARTRGRKTIIDAKNLIVSAAKLYGVRLDLNISFPPKKPKIKKLPTAAQVIHMIRGTDIELPCMLAMWLSLRVSEVRGLQFGDIGKDNCVTVCRSKLYFDGANHVRNVNKTFKSTRMLKVSPYLLDLINAVPHQSEDNFIVQMGYQQIRNHMLALGIPDKYAMERGGWATNSTLKNVYQHTFSAERDQVDKKIDNYFNGILGC